MLHVNGTQILDENDQELQIKGLSLIDIGEAKEYINEIIDTAVRFWNINAVRLPVYPPSVPGRESPYPYQPDNGLIENVLVPAIARADAHDLRAIVDWHQIGPLNDENVASALEFWREALPKINGWDNIVVEVYNEPSNGNAFPVWNSDADNSWDLCKPALQNLVSEVRELTDHLIIAPTPVYCRLPLGANNDPLNGKNIAYSAHVYPPNVWDHEGLAEGFLQEHVDFSNAILDQIRGCTNIPVVVTEVGLNWENQNFIAAFEQLVNEVPLNWVAWVLDTTWWPPLLNEFGAPSRFGKKVKQLML